jgi:hypothetical protein
VVAQSAFAFCLPAVSARAHKSTGAVCLRLPREQFLPLLKMFPDDEEMIAQAALNTFEAVKAGR